MTLTHQISAPRREGPYEGREADCVAAMRPGVAEFFTTQPDELASALQGEIREHLAPLARRAEAAGWGVEEVRTALSRLAREYEGAKGAIFD
ncbi:hypothetical protein ABIE33_006831 [Ensifer sp. 4252]